MKAYACPQLHMLQQANNDSCCTNQMQYSIIIWWHSKRLTAMQTPPGAIKALINLFIYIYIVYLYYFGKLILFLLYVFLVARSSAARSKIYIVRWPATLLPDPLGGLVWQANHLQHCWWSCKPTATVRHTPFCNATFASNFYLQLFAVVLVVANTFDLRLIVRSLLKSLDFYLRNVIA